MTDDKMNGLITNLRRWEGAIPWMYLDNDDPTNVTVGLGVMIANVEEAKQLKFFNYTAMRPATADEIAAEFNRVRNMRGGMHAIRYKSTTITIELPSDEIVRLANEKLATRYLPGIVHYIPKFEILPWEAQQGVVDIAWNVGSLKGFPSLVITLNTYPIDFKKAALQSHRAEPPKGRTRKERNDWTAALFLKCVSPQAVT